MVVCGGWSVFFDLLVPGWSPTIGRSVAVGSWDSLLPSCLNKLWWNSDSWEDGRQLICRSLYIANENKRLNFSAHFSSYFLCNKTENKRQELGLQWILWFQFFVITVLWFLFFDFCFVISGLWFLFCGFCFLILFCFLISVFWFLLAIIANQGKPNAWILAFVWNSCVGLVCSKGKRFECTDPHTNVPPGRHPADARVCKGEFTPGGTLVQGCRTPSASSGEHRSEGLRE